MRNDYPLDPVGLAKMWWPGVTYYDKQRQIIHSVQTNDETVVVAGNQLGKDFVAGYVALSFFMAPWVYFPADYYKQIEATRRGRPDHLVHTRRVITTSVKDDHLRVLWGEIGRYLALSRSPLMATEGGPLVVNHHEIRLKEEAAAKNPVNYLLGQVSAKGEGMAGHHAAYTLCVIDEASGVDEIVYDMAQTWAKKFLVFGNPNPCNNFFKRFVDQGDLLAG